MSSFSGMSDDEIFALGAKGGKSEMTREQLQRWIENQVYEKHKVALTDRAIRESEAVFRERYELHKQRSIEWGVTHLSVPCSCEDGGGPWHWACIRNTPDAIEMHFEHESCLNGLRQMSPGGEYKSEDWSYE